MNAKRNLLDCQSPTELVAMMRDAAQAYRDSQAELSISWQDESAGRIWLTAARGLEALADRLEREWERI